jgi:hypothetical protein
MKKTIKTRACCYPFWVHSTTESKWIHYKPKTKQWIIPTITCQNTDQGLIINYCPFCGEKLKSRANE